VSDLIEQARRLAGGSPRDVEQAKVLTEIAAVEALERIATALERGQA
jgi:hypothetical protein